MGPLLRNSGPNPKSIGFGGGRPRAPTDLRHPRGQVLGTRLGDYRVKKKLWGTPKCDIGWGLGNTVALAFDVARATTRTFGVAILATEPLEGGRGVPQPLTATF